MAKSFENALVYVEGEGLKKINLVFDERIESIGGALGKVNDKLE